MKGMLLVLLFIAVTMVAWGVYGPVLHVGQHDMDGSRWRPFVCVGLAYFVIAVLVPVAMLRTRGEIGHWSVRGTVYSLAAGAAGAVGALGIIMAFNFGGSPIYVMPLVFGCAPVVNTFVTMFLARSFKAAGPLFFAGLILVAAGAVTIMVFKPELAKDEATVPNPSEAPTTTASSPVQTTADIALVAISIIATALCWGAYGPVLHKGQSAMAGSKLRPLICVGLAYFLIAVIVPCAILVAAGESGDWTAKGVVWSLADGAAGAIGALGIIMAFNSGGKPIYVMPLVFGGAPVVNTFTAVVTNLLAGKEMVVNPVFYAGLIIVAVGAVTVLVFSPKSGKKPSQSPVETPAPPAEAPA